MKERFMVDNTSDEIVFELDDPSVVEVIETPDEKTIRRAYRVPLRGLPVSILIGDNLYAVHNLSNSGAGIFITKPEQLKNKPAPFTISINAEEATFSFDAEVSHISVFDTDKYLCGLRFINIDEKNGLAFSNYVSGLRKKK